MPSLPPRILASAAGRSCRNLPSLVVALLLLVLAPAAPRAQAARVTSPVVGTWQVVEWWVRDGKSSDRQYPYGRQPAGLCVYDATGHVVVHVTRGTGEARGDSHWRSLSQDDLRKLVERQLAYFGTYTVDAARGVLSEHVEQDLVQEQAGRAREVPYRLDGDRLILGDGGSWQAVLMRAY